MLIGFSAGPLLGLGLGAGAVHPRHRARLRAGLPGRLAPRRGARARRRHRGGGRPGRPGCSPGRAAAPASCTGPQGPTSRPRAGSSGRRSTSSPAAPVPDDVLPQARDAGELASASWALYQTEHHPAPSVDWQATLLAGHHAVRGAEWLLRECPTGRLLPCVQPLAAAADDVATRYERVADALLRRDHAGLAARPPDPPRGDWPTDLGTGPVPPRRPARLARRPARRPRPHPGCRRRPMPTARTCAGGSPGSPTARPADPSWVSAPRTETDGPAL